MCARRSVATIIILVKDRVRVMNPIVRITRWLEIRDPSAGVIYYKGRLAYYFRLNEKKRERKK